MRVLPASKWVLVSINCPNGGITLLGIIVAQEGIVLNFQTAFARRNPQLYEFYIGTY